MQYTNVERNWKEIFSGAKEGIPFWLLWMGYGVLCINVPQIVSEALTQLPFIPGII